MKGLMVGGMLLFSITTWDDLHLKVSQTTGELQGAQPIVTEDIVFDTEPGFTDPVELFSMYLVFSETS